MVEATKADFDAQTAAEFGQIRPFYDGDDSLQKYRAFIAAHREAERERCAGIAQSYEKTGDVCIQNEIAHAIRSKP
jgi:hypothetical protein